MLGNHFFYQLNQKYVTLFGTLFNDITVIKYNEAHTAEINRIKVPLEYGRRERYLQRLRDPDYNRSVAIMLPRMAFELVGRTYDPERKINSLLRTPKANNATYVDSGYVGVPYNLTFELSIIGRYTEDVDQILEQILPTFNPDYTITALPLPGLGLIKDIPVVLESVQTDYDYPDDFETFRSITHILTFTMPVYYYPAIYPVKIIRTVFANTFIDPLLQTGTTVRVNLNPGNNGTFKIDDTVYQGNSITTSSATGIVTDWLPNSNQLFIGAVQGRFETNVTIHSASTNAAYTIASFDSTPQKVVSIKTEPSPNTAQPGDDFGYSTTITEYANPIL